MMDESPSEDMNICNNISAEEQAKEDIVAEELCKCIIEKFDALTSHNKTENSDPGDGVFAFDAGLEKYSMIHEALVEHNKSLALLKEEMEAFQKKAAEKSYLNCAFPSPKSIRKKETAFNRECKKLEKVWANRGLPVDRESLVAAANKDAFDMAVLKESLPSTSSGEVGSALHTPFAKMEQRIQKMWRQRLPPRPWHMDSDTDRFETKNGSLAVCTSIVKPMVKVDESQRLSAAEIKPPHFLSMRENYLKLARLRRSLQRREHFEKIKNERKMCSDIPPVGDLERRYINYKPSEKTKETENLDAGNSRQNSALQGQEMYKSPEFVFTGKQEEKREDGQNSAAENNQKSIGVKHLNLRRRMTPGWDSEKNWVTDFHFQGTHGSSPNTLTKKEIDRALSKFPPGLHDLRLKIREQSKLRAMNSHRGVVSEDMDEPKSENPFSEEVAIQNKQDNALYLKKLKMCKEIIRSMKESIKGFKSFQSNFPHCSKNSDKVMHD